MGVIGGAQVLFNGIGNSLGDGLVGLYDHATGDTDHECAVLDDAKAEDEKTRARILGMGGGPTGLPATLGQAAADKIFAQEYPDAASELDKDAAGQWSKAKTGVMEQAYNDPLGDLAMVVPGGRGVLLGRLGKAAAAARAAGDMEKAARLEQSVAALRGGRAGAAVRQIGAQKLGPRGQAALDQGQAAAAKYRERRASGARDAGDPLAPHTPQSLAEGQAAADRLRGRRGRGPAETVS